MITKKILLISANNYTIPYPVFPLGVSYLAGHLKKYLPEYDIEIADMLLNSIQDIIELLKKNKYSYIGLSLRNVDDVDMDKKTSFIEHYKNITKYLRHYSDAKIILGGPGFSIFPEKIFNQLNADFGIYGEGEQAILELIHSLDQRKSVDNIQRLVYKKNNIIQKNEIDQLDAEIEGNLFYDDKLINYYWEKGGVLNIQTKRGCPKKCIYCTYPLIDGCNVRVLNPDIIIENIKELNAKKKIDYLFITDSIFNIDEEYNFSFAEKLIKANLNIKWAAYFSPYKLNKKLMTMLKKSGLSHIEFGTDSLSNTQLKNYKKDFLFEDILESSNICNELGIFFAHFLIIGGYGETNQTLDETLANSQHIKNTVYFPFFGMRIYPNTELEQIAIREKIIQENTNLLKPEYYISKNIDLNSFKQKTKLAKERWVLPEEDFSVAMSKMRLKGKKGPLWEYLIR
jgi:radical SAM superfamily enzyme YgiQ (UPF0313 family)